MPPSRPVPRRCAPTPSRVQAPRCPPAGRAGTPGAPSPGRARGPACGDLTFPLATALHLNLRLASARRRASCSSLAKVQCRFWLLLWYMVQPRGGSHTARDGDGDAPGDRGRHARPRPRAARGPGRRRARDVAVGHVPAPAEAFPWEGFRGVGGRGLGRGGGLRALGRGRGV